MDITNRHHAIGVWALLAAVAGATACGPRDHEGTKTSSAAAVRGAGFTTFDATQGGCLDGQNPNGIDCNNYRAKADVYMNGGPSAAGLSDGDYFFAVLVPGNQNGGFVDGADGNLSDTTAGSTTGDTGAGDLVSNRTFSVANHEISAYGGTHAMGTSPNGRSIIQLVPYDDTSNPGGVYILAICSVGATSPSDCKFDAFKAPPSPPPVADAGTPPEDAGTPPEDAGTPPEDAGTPPEDAGTPPEDAGTPPPEDAAVDACPAPAAP